MTDSMVEKIARAIYVMRNGAGCRPWAHLPDDHKAPYRKDARAALTALLEPDEGMLNASPLVGTGVDENGVWCANTRPAREVFTSMIQAALNQKD